MTRCLPVGPTSLPAREMPQSIIQPSTGTLPSGRSRTYTIRATAYYVFGSERKATPYAQVRRAVKCGRLYDKRPLGLDHDGCENVWIPSRRASVR